MNIYTNIFKVLTHMKQRDRDGLFEYIHPVVEPLTFRRNFTIESVKFGTYYGDVDVILHSENFDISFSCILKVHSGIKVSFELSSVKKSFSAKYLFPAIHLDILLKPGDYIRNYYGDNDKSSLEIIDTLLEKTGFIPELSRLCQEIDHKFPKLLQAFDPASLEETTLLYEREIERSKNPLRFKNSRYS